MRTISLIGAAAIALLLTASPTHAEERQPGDEGYMHEEEENRGLHEAYQEFFDQALCSCSKGECRPTLIRPATPSTELSDSMSTYEVLVNGRWCPVPTSAIVTKADVSPETYEELAKYEAHVCAYPEKSYTPTGDRLAVTPPCPTIGCIHTRHVF